MDKEEEIIKNLLNKNDSIEKLIDILEDIKSSHYLKLQATFALKAAQETEINQRGSYFYALSYLDCDLYVKELVDLAFEASYESRCHICDILNHVSEINIKDKKNLIISLELKKELLLNEKTVKIEDIELSNDLIYLINEIKEKEPIKSAQIIQFKKHDK